jgi:hypothetical protein
MTKDEIGQIVYAILMEGVDATTLAARFKIDKRAAGRYLNLCYAVTANIDEDMTAAPMRAQVYSMLDRGYTTTRISQELGMTKNAVRLHKCKWIKRDPLLT